MNHDVHSFAEPHRVRVRHMGLAWSVSFERKVLEGSGTLWVERSDPSAPLVLDTRALEILSVSAGRLAVPEGEVPRLAAARDGFEATAWTLGPADPILGQALVVTLPAEANAVRIEYRTSPNASGLQWLTPAQTAGRTHPFLYSQSQAIHARSWIPCQDSPGVRITFDAEITAPDPLVALMAAEAEGREGASGRFAYVMREPVPAYLLALAVGQLEFRALGSRSGVWAEPSVLPRAADELADIERMIAAVEGLYGPYRWGRYDVLVLPPSFPFGGMENPRLTFATPTILAGDRSLVALIAHELAHSWSGNLVTNARWSDLWLNEGFTVYIERRVVEALYGREREEMEALLGLQDLHRELAGLPPEDQRLALELGGRDPDLALTDVAYEKGALFLRTLEETYGRPRFDAFLQAWFDAHAFTSVTTEVFVAFLRAELLERAAPVAGHGVPDIDAWIHGAGVGPGAPTPSSNAFTQVDAAVQAFVAGQPAATLPTEGWTPQQWLHFLRALPGELSRERLAELDVAWSLTRTGNAEILAEWLAVGIRHGYAAIDARLEAFLVEVGRRKFLVPLYTALLAANRRPDAERIYARARPGYHAIASETLDGLFGR